MDIELITERNKRVCFAGHREVYQREINEKVKNIIADLARQGSIEFLTGGMGKFDRICSGAVRSTKKDFPNMKLWLVLPYMLKSINTQRDYFCELYDEIILPDGSENAHRKAAITMRNRWIVEQSGIMLAYVGRSFGGAYQTIRYAQKHGGVEIINLYKK